MLKTAKGIEINNRDRAPFKKRNRSKEIRRVAKKYNLSLTSGSGYHGEEIINLCQEVIILKK